ncbi:MAG: hypothetical protein IKT70_00065 [Clostridia bacterium]|nr:hypothetical protein [Clostridia bacterium]
MGSSYNLDKGFLVSASWVEAMKCIPSDELGGVIMALMDYQISGGENHLDYSEMSDIARMFCLCVIPHIDNRLENISNGQKGGRPKNQASDKEDTGTKPPFSENKTPPFHEDGEKENLKLSKDKLSKDKSSQVESSTSPECEEAPGQMGEEAVEEDADDILAKRERAFTAFMAEYPRKQRVTEAKHMFEEIGVFDTEELMSLLDRWKKSEEWRKEGGRFIPCADKFLREIYGFRLEPSRKEHNGSFDTDEFFSAALRRSFTEELNGG